LGEFLLADAGYALKDFTLTPYRQPLADIPHNKVFNEVFSSARVVIEHVNGILKARFSSLKGIRTQIKNADELKQVCDHVQVCLILHNLLLQYNDEWLDVDDDDDEDELTEDEVNARVDVTSGHHLRAKVQTHVLRKYFS
jgi:hypothetical protein